MENEGAMKRKPSAPPPVLVGARLLAYAIIDETVIHVGTSTLFVDAKPIGIVPCLAIVQKSVEDVLLLFCDEQWNPIGVVGCASLSDAQSRAEREYGGLSTKWISSNVSEQEAARYLKEQNEMWRCSFCGKAPEAVQQLFSTSTARICDSCIRDFYQMLRAPSES